MPVTSRDSGTIFWSGRSPSTNSKLPSVQRKHVVDRLLGLLPHEAQQVRLCDRVDHDQDLAEEDLGLLLDLHGHLQLLLADVAVGDQKVAQVLPLVGRGGRGDPAVLEIDALLHPVPVDQERAGLGAQGEPLKQLSQLHRLQIAGDSHLCGLESPILAQETVGQ
jgi:hypothetical protein